MSTVVIHYDSFEVSFRAEAGLAGVTPRLGQIVAASAVRQGSVHVTAIGSTASLTTELG